MAKPHYTIPFFIQHGGCPFACIFCDQNKITGRSKAVGPSDIPPVVRKYLRTIPAWSHVQIGFFGGSFTGLPVKRQRAFLEKAARFIGRGVAGIRVSTRPDMIDKKRLIFLKKYGVTCIELGVQSLKARVLKRAQRGHSAEDVKKASALILSHGIMLGHQIMVGLPSSTLRDETDTARMSVRMGPSEVRIYPVLVIKRTGLASMFDNGAYRPLTEKEAISRCARLIGIYEQAGIRVIRCGLHPSEGLISGRDIVAGPFHPSFRTKVGSYRYRLALKKGLAAAGTMGGKKAFRIFYHPVEAGYVLGYMKENIGYIEKRLGFRPELSPSQKISRGSLKFAYDNGGVLTVRVQ